MAIKKTPRKRYSKQCVRAEQYHILPTQLIIDRKNNDAGKPKRNEFAENEMIFFDRCYVDLFNGADLFFLTILNAADMPLIENTRETTMAGTIKI